MLISLLYILYFTRRTYLKICSSRYRFDLSCVYQCRIIKKKKGNRSDSIHQIVWDKLIIVSVTLLVDISISMILSNVNAIIELLCFFFFFINWHVSYIFFFSNKNQIKVCRDIPFSEYNQIFYRGICNAELVKPQTCHVSILITAKQYGYLLYLQKHVKLKEKENHWFLIVVISFVL